MMSRREESLSIIDVNMCAYLALGRNGTRTARPAGRFSAFSSEFRRDGLALALRRAYPQGPVHVHAHAHAVIDARCSMPDAGRDSLTIRNHPFAHMRHELLFN